MVVGAGGFVVGGAAVGAVVGCALTVVAVAAPGAFVGAGVAGVLVLDPPAGAAAVVGASDAGTVVVAPWLTAVDDVGEFELHAASAAKPATRTTREGLMVGQIYGRASGRDCQSVGAPTP